MAAAFISKRRFGSNVANLNGLIFVIGGRDFFDESCEKKSVKVFDTKIRQWREVA